MAPRWVEKYIGIPFKDRGLSHKGCDCWGLVRLILGERINLWLPEYPDIAEGAALNKLRQIVTASKSPEWVEVPAGEEGTYNVALMRGLVENDGHKYQRPIHIGLVLEPGLLIHVEYGAATNVTDYRKDLRTKNRIHGFYRHASL